MSGKTTEDLLRKILEELVSLRKAVEDNACTTAEIGTTSAPNRNTSLVPAKCTECGAPLEVDPTQQAAVCPYCGQPYIVTKAINNVNVSAKGDVHIEGAVVNITGQDADDYIERAERFESSREWNKAIEYYEKALDIDVTSAEALEGLWRAKEERRSFVFAEEPEVTKGLLNYGTLKLMWERLVFENNRGNVETFEFDNIGNLREDAHYLRFDVPGEAVKILPRDANNWVSLIRLAMQGRYPKVS